LMPGSGDSVQALKAGVMEIPDVIVVNKADHPLTDTLVREIRGVLALGSERREDDWRVPIVKTVAAEGKGIEELAGVLLAHREHIVALGLLEQRRRRNLRNEILALASARIRRQLEARLGDGAELGKLLDAVLARQIDPARAAARLLEEMPAG
jgi:LAO/AO transport system kinase